MTVRSRPSGGDEADDSSAPLTPEALCRQYLDRVYRYAVLVSRGPLEAEDLAHDSLLRAIRHLHQYDPKRGAFDAWLWRIVANQAKDLARAKARATTLWLRLVREPAALESVEKLVFDRLALQDIVSAINQLPASDRHLLALRMGAGLSFADVASIVGLTEAAAMVATHRALAKLRKRLG